jgi:hypothetical protein
MPKKRHEPEGIVAKLGQLCVPVSQVSGVSALETVQGFREGRLSG